MRSAIAIHVELNGPQTMNLLSYTAPRTFQSSWSRTPCFVSSLISARTLVSPSPGLCLPLGPISLSSLLRFIASPSLAVSKLSAIRRAVSDCLGSRASPCPTSRSSPWYLPAPRLALSGVQAARTLQDLELREWRFVDVGTRPMAWMSSNMKSGVERATS